MQIVFFNIAILVEMGTSFAMMACAAYRLCTMFVMLK